ncbi:fluconazole resistance protein 3 [Physcia stellaris]|nr:fluconazole resistance protein 3 [Physcia stellaris]
MDYSYFSTTEPYGFYNLPQKPGHPYTPQDDFSGNPIDTYADPTAFQSFDQSFSFQNPLLPQAAPQQPQSPPNSLHRPSLPTSMSQDITPDLGLDMEGYDQGQGARSSDDEKEGRTPAQSRRKAQNRAAQRAFRERKERHVKEIKLNNLTSTNASILTEKERLEREVERLATQNEILRATAQTFPTSTSPHRPESPVSGPQVFSPTSFLAAMTEGHGPATADHGGSSGTASGSRSTPDISHRIAISPTTGERLLGTGPTWDLIQGHELYQKGMVDLALLCENLKGKAICDGTGPAYPESAVRKAVEESVSGAGDELI